MAASNVNVVVITGNLTQDPELRSTNSGTSVCEMRVAVNSRRKDQSGQWVDKPNFFNVVVFGAQADNCATYLQRGRPVAIEGRLDWREWEAKDGSKRQAVQIIANSVQFLGSRDGGGGAPNGNGGGGQQQQQPPQQQQPYSPPASDVPADESDFGPVPTGGGQEDDIPF